MSTPITAPRLVTAIEVTDTVTGTVTAEYRVQNADRMSIQVNAVDATPTDQDFVAADVDVDEDTITIEDHGFFTGLEVALTGTNLPTGLSATDYWAIVVDEDTIKLASTKAFALAGTPVDITAQGTTADANLAPAALDETTVEVKASLDGENWFSYATPKVIDITVTGNQFLDCGQLSVPFVQITWTAPVEGALTLTVLAWFQNTQVKNNS